MLTSLPMVCACFFLCFGISDVVTVTATGRFNVNSMWGERYRERYWKQELFDTVEVLKTAASKLGLSPVDVAHQWLMHHSCLDGSKGDKLIIGASSVEHAEANFAACSKGPLPDDIIAVLDQGWRLHMPNCPNYFR